MSDDGAQAERYRMNAAISRWRAKLAKDVEMALSFEADADRYDRLAAGDVERTVEVEPTTPCLEDRRSAN